MEVFKTELAALINKYGIDADTNTPDFMLAEIAVDAIASFGAMVKTRDEYKTKAIAPQVPEIPKEVLKMADAVAKALGGNCTVEIIQAQPMRKHKNRKKKNHGKDAKI